ncbi:MAG: hypothetical protein KC636_15770 [Myxococcales bacterium]|nr:hypothetical protein [Myxococcales bacterium]
MIGSVVFHVGLVIVSSMLPDGSERGGAAGRDRLFTPGAVVVVETVPPVTAKTEPTRPRVPEIFSDDPATAPIDHPRTATPSPAGGGESPPEPTEAQSEPSTPGLSLHGMRDGSRPSTAGSVVVDPALLQGSREAYEDAVQNPGVGGGAVQGPAAPPSESVDYAFRREKDKLVYRDPHGRFVATLRPDGRVDFRNKGAKASWTNIGMAGPGDLIAAAAGEDPYARIKAKLLKATFEMRLEMAVSFQKKQLDKRLRRLSTDLEKIWTNDHRALEERRELLFQRWDECDEPDEVAAQVSEVPGFGAIESSDLDAARLDAAQSARRLIERFVREHAPKGTPEGYTAAELEDMNRRRASQQKFNPY